MKFEQSPEDLEGARAEYERQEELSRPKGYTPRPRWHIVMAWVLFGIVVLGIINLVYWQFTA